MAKVLCKRTNGLYEWIEIKEPVLFIEDPLPSIEDYVYKKLKLKGEKALKKIEELEKEFWKKVSELKVPESKEESK